MKIKFLLAPFMVIMISTMISCSSEDSVTPMTENVAILPTNNSINAKIAAPSQVTAVEYNYSDSELETIALINNHRNEIGLKKLELLNYISSKSEEHDNYMISVNTLTHDGFDVRSQNIASVLGAKKVGENIAFDYSTAQGVLNAWMSSSVHKGNIEGDYTNIGIAIKVNLDGKKYYTSIFVKI